MAVKVQGKLKATRSTNIYIFTNSFRCKHANMPFSRFCVQHQGSEHALGDSAPPEEPSGLSEDGAEYLTKALHAPKLAPDLKAGDRV